MVMVQKRNMIVNELLKADTQFIKKATLEVSAANREKNLPIN